MESSEARGQGRQQSGRGRRRALGPEAVACSEQSDRVVLRRRRALGMKWLRARSVGGGVLWAVAESRRAP
jgi:hypothetical protein